MHLYYATKEIGDSAIKDLVHIHHRRSSYMYFDLLGFNLFDPFLDPPLSLSELSRVVHTFIDIIDSVFT